MRWSLRQRRCWPRRSHVVVSMLRWRRDLAGRVISTASDIATKTSNPTRRVDKDAHHVRAREAPARFDANLLVGPLAASLQSLYDVLPVALGVIDRHGRYLAANTAYAAIHGVTPRQLVGRVVADYVPEAERQLREGFRRFDAGMDAAIEREVTCQGGHYLSMLRPVRDDLGNVQGVTSVLIDITSRKRTEQAMDNARRYWQFHASHDHLTGLPNRRQIDDVLLVQACRCASAGSPLSVMMIDVDYFKNYNDHEGHLRGDDCLRTIAAQLKLRMRRHVDLVGRYGGEEFIAILPDTDGAGAYRVAQGVLEDVRMLGIAHPSSPYGCVTLSIGIATLECSCDQMQSRCDALLGRADRALYAAKAAGRNRVSIHSSNP